MIPLKQEKDKICSLTYQNMWMPILFLTCIGLALNRKSHSIIIHSKMHFRYTIHDKCSLQKKTKGLQVNLPTTVFFSGSYGKKNVYIPKLCSLNKILETAIDNLYKKIVKISGANWVTVSGERQLASGRTGRNRTETEPGGRTDQGPSSQWCESSVDKKWSFGPSGRPRGRTERGLEMHWTRLQWLQGSFDDVIFSDWMGSWAWGKGRGPSTTAQIESAMFCDTKVSRSYFQVKSCRFGDLVIRFKKDDSNNKTNKQN